MPRAGLAWGLVWGEPQSLGVGQAARAMVPLSPLFAALSVALWVVFASDAFCSWGMDKWRTSASHLVPSDGLFLPSA